MVCLTNQLKQSVETINNSGGSGLVDIFTPPTTGLYRLSVYQVVTTGSLVTQIKWTDEAGRHGVALPASDVSDASQDLRVLADTIIQISTVSGTNPISNPPSPGSFKVYWIVEQLS